MNADFPVTPRDGIREEYIKKLDELACSTIPREAELKHRFADDFFQRRIQSRLRPRARKISGPRVLRLLTRTAACFLALLLFAALVFGPTQLLTAAQDFGRVLMRDLGKYTELIFSSKAPTDKTTNESKAAYPPLPAALPEGFTLFEDTSSTLDVWQGYRKPTGQEIFYAVSPTQSLSVGLNTEGVELHQSTYKEQTYYYFSRENNHFVFWYDERFFFMITGTASLEDLIKMAEAQIEQGR